MSRSATTSRTLSGTPTWAAGADDPAAARPAATTPLGHQVPPQLTDVEGVAAAVAWPAPKPGRAGRRRARGRPRWPRTARRSPGRGRERRRRLAPSVRRRSARQPASGSVTSSPVSRNVPITSRRRGRARPGQVTQQGQRRGAGPVQVVDHDHGRPAPGGIGEEGVDGVEQPVPLGLGVGRRRTAQPGHQPFQLGHEPGRPRPGRRPARRRRSAGMARTRWSSTCTQGW